MVASRATIRDTIDKVIMIRYSCFCGFHSGGTSLAASMSLGVRNGGFSREMDDVEVGVKGSPETATAMLKGSFSDILEGWDRGEVREGKKVSSSDIVWRRDRTVKTFLPRASLVFKVHVLTAFI